MTKCYIVKSYRKDGVVLIDSIYLSKGYAELRVLSAFKAEPHLYFRAVEMEILDCEDLRDGIC